MSSGKNTRLKAIHSRLKRLENLNSFNSPCLVKHKEREIYRDIQGGVTSFDVFTYVSLRAKNQTFVDFYDARLELMLQGQLIIVKKKDIEKFFALTYDIDQTLKGGLICVTYQVEKKPFDKVKISKPDPYWIDSWIEIYNDYIDNYLPTIYKQLLTS
jgi:hypothetical protein